MGEYTSLINKLKKTSIYMCIELAMFVLVIRKHKQTLAHAKESKKHSRKAKKNKFPQKHP